MAFVASLNSRIFVGSLAWTQYTRSKSLSMDTNMLDVTTLNDADMAYIPGQNSGTVSLDMLLDNAGAAGSQFITFNTWKGATQVVTLAFEGTTRGTSPSTPPPLMSCRCPVRTTPMARSATA